MIETLGWASQIIFMLSGLPQAYRCWVQGHGEGLSVGLILMWFIGEGLAIIYGFLVDLPTPIMVNYIVNFISLLFIMRYKFKPIKREIR